ncbi:MAG: hypothetical protein ACTSUE_09105, partial [Promethearchaeota archaeon]
LQQVQTQVNEIADRALSNIYAEGNVGIEHDIYIQLRAGKMRQINNKRILDVVKIGWIPFMYEGIPLDRKPRDLAKMVWCALEQAAKERGRILRVESIMSEKLYDHLVKNRGYTPDSYDPLSLLHVT